MPDCGSVVIVMGHAKKIKVLKNFASPLVALECFGNSTFDTFRARKFVGVTDSYIRIFRKLKVIYHPLYGMNNYVLIWGDWLSCDPLRGSHDSQS